VKAPPLLGLALEASEFTIAEWSDDGESSADRPVAPLHLHERDDEAWYVLEGALAFRRDDETIEAPAGSAVVVPAGAAHTYWNAGEGRARYLIVMPPRVASLIAALHEPFEDIDELFRRFDSRLVR
jgi:mannose-6-phosphate isomerase-like protein (cupin superfamily)